MDPLRSPGPASPRMRPSGPRTRRQVYKAATPLSLTGGMDEVAPAYSGRESPALSSHAGSSCSPATASFEHLPEPAHAFPDDLRTSRDQGVQTTSADLPSPPNTRSSTPAVKLITKQLTLTPPPALDFDPIPIAWRGMTLETAQWSLNSNQLQDIVSRAIRRTAQESFIRLVSVKTLDEELTTELERLETLKATTQSQYKFNMHRRTMLLQSLLALSSGDGDSSSISNLTTQLADVTATCDRLMLELVRVVDQRAQIHRLHDVHISSALAMALRKLNTSYAKRTTELREAKEQTEQLKAELEEAWQVAENMAQEMDDLDNFHSGFSSESEADDDDRRLDESVRLAEVIGVTGHAVAMKATLTQIAAGRDRARERDTQTMSDRSRRVSAARKRSSRASKASLRIPKSSKGSVGGVETTSVSSRMSRNRSLRRRSTESGEPSAPPIPTIQIDTASIRREPKDDSFLEMAETRPVSPISPTGQERPVPPLPQQTDHLENGNTAVPEAGPSSHSKHATLDFQVPPITIHPPDEGDTSGSASSRMALSRRVQSMQPAARKSLDENRSSVAITRSASEYRKFDGWPWAGAAKNTRRRSMPLTNSFNEGSPAANGASTRTIYPRVFSPPP